MTRFLSESLGAAEPFFRVGLQKLEAANGHPNTDIRFSSEVMHGAKSKLPELGLDPHDSTPQEVYHTLKEKVRSADVKLTKILQTMAASHVSAEGNPVDGMVHVLKSLPDSKRCFALKNSRIKAMLKKQPPKKAMKQLGYRSLESFLRHEAPISALSAAWLTEGANWQRRFTEQYKQLNATDFEERSITLLRPEGQRWRQLAMRSVAEKRHNLLSFKELGALVFLPFSDDAPSGSVTASLCLALHELNEIRASSAFLKLNQVRPDFGQIVQEVAKGEPRLSSQLLDQPVPWNLLQRYYAGLAGVYDKEHVLEPYLHFDDMVWYPVEETLSLIEPSFRLWQGSSHLGILHEGKAVSMNVIDAALNYCNDLSFEDRITHYFKHSLWNEMLLRYLRRDAVEETIAAEVQPQLAEEMVAA
jgi:hypothetical protein